MPTEYATKTPIELAKLYEESHKSIHGDREFWNAYLKSGACPAGRIMATYFLWMIEKNTQEIEDMNEFLSGFVPDGFGNW